MPKVSCIIPVYNVEQYLVRCLDSIFAQTMTEYEVICVNDCSPDRSQDILEEYQKKYPEKLRIIQNETNMGQGKSRARAIQEACGEYICFVDSDDYIKKDYMETYLREMESGDYDVVIGGYIRDQEGKCRECMVADSEWSMLTYTVAWGKLFRRKFLVEHRIDFSDKRQGEDIYFSLSVYYHSQKYKVFSYAGYYYYFNRTSTTGKMNHAIHFERVVADMFDTFLEHCPVEKVSEEKRRHIEYDYLANMINALVTYGHGCKPGIMKEKYEFFMRDLRKKFPDYKNNPYTGIFKPKGQTLKIRLGVGMTILLHRMHLDRCLFFVISWI